MIILNNSFTFTFQEIGCEFFCFKSTVSRLMNIDNTFVAANRQMNIAHTNPDQLIQNEEHILNAMKHLTLPDTY